MTKKEKFMVMIFPAVSYALKAEKILKQQKIPHKLIPIPKHIDSDCGVCVRFSPEQRENIEEALIGKVKSNGVINL